MIDQSNKLRIPPELWDYQEVPANFITYFGEIYNGILVDPLECPDRIYIVQNDKRREFFQLEKDQRTPESFRKFGREIRDLRVIKEVVPGNIGTNDEGFYGDPFNNGEEFKRMFVFGAGASTFCQPKKHIEEFRNCSWNPPTGYEVFDHKYSEILNKYPGAKASVSKFESRDRDIEGCLQEEWEMFQSTYNPSIANRHINIQFYLQELFTCISNEVVENYYHHNLYSLLVNKLQESVASNPKERISLVSFNYDTVLDQFVEQVFGQVLHNIADYVNWEQNQLMLFKPHGSCNWGWNLKNSKGGSQSVSDHLWKEQTEPWEIYFQLIGNYNDVIAKNSWGIESQFHDHRLGKLVLNKNILTLRPEDSNTPFFPAMLIPYREKDEFLMPYRHYHNMTTCIGKIEELYLIGWKGNEKLFNKELKRAGNLKKIIIANPEAEKVEKTLENYLDLDQIEIVRLHSFDELVSEKLDDLLVKA